MDNIKIIICHPNGLPVSQPTIKSINALAARVDLPFGILVNPLEGALLQHSRNYGVGDKLKWTKSDKVEEYEYYLMLDADMEFDPEDLIRLYNTKKMIISGASVPRGYSYKLNAGMWGSISGTTPEDRIIRSTDTGLIKVDWCGAAFLLIRKEAFNKMSYPWFDCRTIETSEGVEQTAEDIGFCMNAQESDIDIWFDCECRITHHTHLRKQVNAMSGEIVEQHKETIELMQLDFYMNASLQQSAFNKIVEAYRGKILEVEKLKEEVKHWKTQVTPKE